jgi:hypothetical protein
VQIDVRIEGLEKLQAGVAAAPATLASEVRTAMMAGSLLVEGTARSLAPKDTGRLAGSITHAISGGGANLSSKIGPSVAWGIVIEKGRRPGRPAPPIAALRPWARRHGIPESALFVVARSIGRKGIKARPYMVPALDQNRGRIIALFEKTGLRVVARMAG